jgi:hypothetical protein
MGTLCMLLHCGPRPTNGETARLWVEPGTPCFLGRGAWLTVERFRCDLTGWSRLRLRLAGLPFISGAFPVGTTLNLTLSAGLRIVPRAIEYRDGTPLRALLEFQSEGHPRPEELVA